MTMNDDWMMDADALGESDHSQKTPQLHPEDLRERDACALICAVRKGGQATHGNVKRTIEALARMGHRTGFIDGEGDGVGIMTDIPRELWAKALALRGMRSSLATHPGFWVAHLMIPQHERHNRETLTTAICQRLQDAGLDMLIERNGLVNSHVLGRRAERVEPLFIQLAGMNGRVAIDRLEPIIYQLQKTIERDFGVHFPSFSSRSVVYKVQGTVEILRRYYPELRDPEYASIVTLGHARYSTNTNPIFERAQPFNLLGHNGEFNTISRFRLEAQMLNIDLPVFNSDSQDVDAVIDALCMTYGLDLIEAMEHVFPPFTHDLPDSDEQMRAMYDEIRRAFGPFAQGPAAVAARVGDHCVFSVDALGLRPLWFGESEKEYFATSERGVYPLDTMSSAPKPLAPGEKIALIIRPGQGIEVLDHSAIQQHVLRRWRDRGYARLGDAPIAQRWTDAPTLTDAAPIDDPTPFRTPTEPTATRVMQATILNTTALAALGWERYHLNVVGTLAEVSKEQVGSLGWDGPLAAISRTRVNIADHFKETVAVVTNPSIDRERERAQFSTEAIIGVRPLIAEGYGAGDRSIRLGLPLLTGGHPALGGQAVMDGVAP